MTSFLPQNNWLLAAGVAGCAFVGYALYFDYKRTHAPNYKEKIRENRKRKTHQGTLHKPGGKMPDPTNMEEMQNFFLQEVQLGEELMTDGMISEGLDHLSNAIVLCAHPQQLLSIFNQTLPPEHFQMLITRIPEAKMRVAKMFGSQIAGMGPQLGTAIDDDDDEGPTMVYMAPRTDQQPTSGAIGMVDADDLE